jgi:MarR family transcriptional regulator, temperature-dependent positive regulator of motility
MLSVLSDFYGMAPTLPLWAQHVKSRYVRGEAGKQGEQAEVRRGLDTLSGGAQESVSTRSKIPRGGPVPCRPVRRRRARKSGERMAAVDLSTHPGHLARRLQQAHTLLWGAMVSEETTSPQFAVLNALEEKPGMDQRTLSEHVRLDRSTIADLVARLAGRELVERVRDPEDGRRNVLRLTEDGRRLHRRLVARTARMNRVFLAPLDAGEQETLLRLIGRVAQAAEELRG